MSAKITELRKLATELAAKADNAKAYLMAVGIQHEQALAEYEAAMRELDECHEALTQAEIEEHERSLADYE